MAEILKLRREQAALLGYRDFAQMSLEHKMARTPARARAFLERLHRRVSPKASLEWQALQSFARAELGLADVQPWDIAFVAERMRERCFGVSTQDVRRYFPEHAVLRGLFALVETLFDIRIRADEGSVWHQDVRRYRLETLRGEPLAALDRGVYERARKRARAGAAGASRRDAHDVDVTLMNWRRFGMTIEVGLLLFPQVQQLDLTGPHDVFASLPGVTVRLVWKTREPVAWGPRGAGWGRGPGRRHPPMRRSNRRCARPASSRMRPRQSPSPTA